MSRSPEWWPFGSGLRPDSDTGHSFRTLKLSGSDVQLVKFHIRSERDAPFLCNTSF
jgi:hypothetical protein